MKKIKLKLQENETKNHKQKMRTKEKTMKTKRNKKIKKDKKNEKKTKNSRKTKLRLAGRAISNNITKNTRSIPHLGTAIRK